MKKILILGAGFGGLETATRLRAHMGDGYEVTLIDRSDSFFIGFAKIDVLFGHRTEAQVRYPYAKLRAEGVRFVQDTITAIDTDAKAVETLGGRFDYDYLVVALGADLDPDAIPGFVESGGHEFYSMAGTQRLRGALDAFTGGALVLGIFRPPYKCPPAPYEVAAQLHEHFEQRGMRDRVDMKMVIPGPRPVPNPRVSDALEALLRDRGIELVASAPIGRVDAERSVLETGSGEIPFDLFVGVPVHAPPAVVLASSLSDGSFIDASTETLETRVPNVYALGDVAKLPVGDKAVPKAGAFAENAARTVASDILLKEGLVEAREKFEARGACYFELGGGEVAKVVANYLGGDKPNVVVEGPARALLADKHEFETSRRDRWFALD